MNMAEGKAEHFRAQAMYDVSFSSQPHDAAVISFSDQLNEAWYPAISNTDVSLRGISEISRPTDGAKSERSSHGNIATDGQGDCWGLHKNVPKTWVIRTGDACNRGEKVNNDNTQETAGDILADNSSDCSETHVGKSLANRNNDSKQNGETVDQLWEEECAECGRFFISTEHYKAHCKSHAIQNTESDEQLRYADNLELGGFNCLDCGKHILRKDHMKRHVLTHEKRKAKEVENEVVKNSAQSDLVCSECGKQFKDTVVLKRHEKFHEKKKEKVKVKSRTKFSCSECGKCFKRKCYLERHEVSHKETRKKKTSSQKLDSTSIVHGITPHDTNNKKASHVEDEYDAFELVPDDTDERTCDATDNAVGNAVEVKSSTDDLSESVEKCRQGDDGKECGIVEKTKQEKHAISGSNGLYCEEVAPEASTTKYNCFECGKQFEFKYRLKRHSLCHEARRLKEIHRRDKMAAERDGSPGDIKKRKRKLVDVYCKVCDKYFNRMDHLKRHEMIHAPGRIRAKPKPAEGRLLPFKCGKCSRSFSKAEFLDKHEITHLKKCEFCMEPFQTKAELKEHMVIHKDEMPNICHVCGKLFHLRKQLQKHKDVHRPHDPDFQPYVCQVCGFSCRSRVILQRHQADHFGRPFMCQVCGKAFKVRADLTNHCVIHFGTKKHKCHVCGKAFFVAKDMMRHVKTHRRQKYIE